jgi:YD repeat-containing protein
MAVSGAGARTYAYDAVGSVTADGATSFGYDARGRLVQTSNAGGATDYNVNAFGQRIRKTGSQADTVFHYDAQGRLIAESNAAGQILKEYIYLGDIPVAVLQ